MDIEGAAKLIVWGHVSLAICFLLYLFWWWVFFCPRAQGVSGGMRTTGVLALIGAFVFGLMGLCLCIYALFAIPSTGCVVKPWQIGIVGVVVYFALLPVTVTLFKRPLTSELAIELAWVTLEFAIIDELLGANALKGGLVAILTVLLVSLFVLGLVCYLRFYHLDGMSAYVCGAIPLVCAAAHAVLMVLVVKGAVG